MSTKQLLEAIAVTAEMTGTTLSPAAARAMFDELKRYPEHQVLGALMSCRRQLQHRLTLADILARLEDGRPGPEEAWATVAQTRSEGVTVVWTDEMRIAAGVARGLITEDDMVPARMAFLEAYRKIVQAARDAGAPVRWTISLGHDLGGREGPIREAMEKGRISGPVAQQFLPARVLHLPKKLQDGLKSLVEKQP